ncbi:fimbrial biogenesis outer membrane usher protein [Dyella sp. LX-66]|uniref:fimbria/pilus outer membrane usher protein n=1 Tax=unclassified Dyella TaxID=2634549 RepID=UPI001BE036FF|nr:MULTISPECIES: fimbria/pilus outer membrane usher protein [unclassified Dyella]MBT2118864.1 fimbrial biogenesis outer membrane usher protein [Dyella sp. LX-1]MBT2140143.1 fimbrial biogenesis outer membrane usher protein [Dyella sp. LX-66]
MFATTFRPAGGGWGLLRPRKLHVWLMCALAGVSPLAAQAMQVADGKPADALEFDPVFLSGGAGSADLARFRSGNHVAPGSYRVNVYVNGDPRGDETLRFVAAVPDGDAAACLDGDFLLRLGVALPDDASAGDCVDLPQRIASARVRFDPGEQRLDISVPQASMRRQARGYVDPARWDDGIAAGTLNYNFNMSQSWNRGHRQRDGYLGLVGGLNLGGWQLRHQSSLQWSDSGRGLRWQALRNYAQHDLTALRSRLTVGDFVTGGELFDAVALRGAQVASDDQMLPDSQQGYAPVVRGIAVSNAVVTVRQNGYVIYETTVAAGPFRIDDLYPTGYGGDLEVTVREASGQEQHFSVPYAAVNRLLRPGLSRYSVALGQYRSAEGLAHPLVFQGTWQRGLSNRITAYGGAVLAKDYQAVQFGAAFNTRLGAFGLDVTHARAAVPAPEAAAQYLSGDSLLRPLAKRHMQGESVRLTYSKAISATGTNVSVAAYRYSTGGYLSLRDAVLAQGRGTAALRRQRSSAQVTISQPLGQGALYLTGSAQNYWGRGGADAQFQFGYSGAARWFNYSISASRSRAGDGRMDNRVFASLSIPFGGGNVDLGGGTGRGGSDGRISFSRTAGDRAAYGLSLARDAAGSASWNASGSYRSPLAVLTGSVSGGQGYRQAAFGATGAAVIHAGGIALGQGMGDTIALVKAPDAAGAGLSMSPGAKIDRRGYAIVPYLTPYRRNSIELNPQDLSAGVELLESSHDVVPRSGAVVMAAFKTRKGRVAVIDLKPADGVTIPFGSDVFDPSGQQVGVVSQGGRALVRGIAEEGRLTVRLDERRACSFHYRLPPAHPERSGARDYAYLQSGCAVVAPGVEAELLRGPHPAVITMDRHDSGQQ